LKMSKKHLTDAQARHLLLLVMDLCSLKDLLKIQGTSRFKLLPTLKEIPFTFLIEIAQSKEDIKKS